MSKKIKTLSAVILVSLFTSASAYACGGCGCQAKKETATCDKAKTEKCEKKASCDSTKAATCEKNVQKKSCCKKK